MITIQIQNSTRTSCKPYLGRQKSCCMKQCPLPALSALLNLTAHKAAARVLMQHCCLPPGGGGGGRERRLHK